MKISKKISMLNLFLILIFVLNIFFFISCKSNSTDGESVPSTDNHFFKIDYPKPNTPLKGRITVKGSHDFDISSHIWILLSDGYGYYLQSPETSLYEGQWEHNNVNLGGGIKSIVAVLVNEKGHEEFLKKARNNEWGQFKKLPKGSKKIAAIPIKN